jgi:predicted transcriptional regulator
LVNHKSEIINHKSDLTIAVANLAAAAMANNPKLSMADAVKQATDVLRGQTISDEQIANSVRPDKIQCLEDGTWHIMLRRYIKRKFNLTPDEYRARWNLAADYPLVAPNYATKRSKIAKKTGLGRK